MTRWRVRIIVEIDQRERRLSGFAAVEVPRVVLDAVDVAGFLEHLEVVGRALREALGLEEFVGRAQLRKPGIEFASDVCQHALEPYRRRHVVRGREDRHLVERSDRAADVPRGDPLDVVAAALDADPVFVRGLRKHFDGVTLHAERPAGEVHVIPLELEIHELPDEAAPLDAVPAMERNPNIPILLRRAEAVDARDRRDDDDVGSREE